MPSASGSSTGRRQSGARSSCPRRTTISMNYSVTWPRRPTTRATGDGDSAWMPPTTKLSNVLRNPVQLRTRGEGAFRRPRWPVFSDLHPSGAATARRAAESGGRSGSALVRRARPRSCPPPGAGRMRACGAPSHDRRTPRTLAGRDWTGLDWTGLDWTGLDELPHRPAAVRQGDAGLDAVLARPQPPVPRLRPAAAVPARRRSAGRDRSRPDRHLLGLTERGTTAGCCTAATRSAPMSQLILLFPGAAQRSVTH
jgi:hypothetical protein